MNSPKKFYVSTSIAYVNGAPHVGFAMESIQADVLARWARSQGRKTFFSTGTDEHGEKIQKTAEAQNTTPQQICDTNAAEFQKLADVLDISNDDFIRTSDQKKHWPSVQKLWKILSKNGDIEKREYTDKYCYGCEEFKLDKDLDENGNCPNHLRPPEEISEENYFFLLSKYSKKIAELIESNQLQIVPEFRKNEILNMAKDGLHDVSFSRPSKKLPWGIPVPNDESQNMYVWCDALTNYISVLGYGENENPPVKGEGSKSETGGLNHSGSQPPFTGRSQSKFENFWNQAEVVHVIGKDIVRFHAGIWIGMLLSAGIKLPDKIFIHGFLTSEGHKMSKSLGNVVDPFLEVQKYGSDALRYFLLREVPVGKDADFSRARFEEIYQAHLANGLGNLVSRIYNLCIKAEINSVGGLPIPQENFKNFLETKEKNLHAKMKNFALNDAIAEIFSVVDFCDLNINEKKPWELQKTNPEENKIFLHDLLSAIVWIQKNIGVFLPKTAEKIKNIFGITNLVGAQNLVPFGALHMLFPRIEKLNLPAETLGTQHLVPSTNIEFSITPQAQKAGIHAEYIFLDNIAVKKTPKGMQKFCKKAARQWIEEGGKNNSEWKEKITQMNQVKKDLGFSNLQLNSGTEIINASESLANLVEKNTKLPNFTNIVDLYNIISLKHGLSAGAHDCAFLDEEVSIGLTTGEEKFSPMTGKEHLNTEGNPIQKGEYAFFIKENEIGCRFDSGQCEESKILEGNKNILIYFQSPVGKEQWAKDAMTEFLELLKTYGLQ